MSNFTANLLSGAFDTLKIIKSLLIGLLIALSIGSQADVVVTYGSTTGIEAAFMGRSVVVLGPSAYDNLGCAVRPADVDRLREVIQSPQEGDQSGAIAFGLMMQRRGFNLTRLTRNDSESFAIGGKTISQPHSLARKLSDWRARRLRTRISGGLW